MASGQDRSAAEIWEGDLLGRRAEANLLAGYIDSLFERPGPSRGSQAFTIAVDAEYGRGKSYFLKRIAEQMSSDHPVAFIDAWSDDLADQPLIALTATLKAALAPFLAVPEVKSEWSKFAAKTGKVAKIAGIGLLKRGLSLVITQGATELIGDTLDGLDDDLVEKISEQAQAASEEAVGAGFDALKFGQVLEEKIQTFESAREAMADMKRSLEAVLKAIPSTQYRLPVIIVIDELDRCRPSYAVKLLEEIKHLFDVPGIVFLLGLHGDQLARSISGVYGHAFDGKSYLKRFIHRRYLLREPNTQDLVRQLMDSYGLSGGRFAHLSNYTVRGGRVSSADAAKIVQIYCEIFKLTPREIYELVEILDTSNRVVEPNLIALQYFLPLVAGHIRGADYGKALEFPPERPESQVSFVWRNNSSFSPSTLFEQLKYLASLDPRSLRELWNKSEDYEINLISELTFSQKEPNSLAEPRNYPSLITAVSRFEGLRAQDHSG